MPKSQTHLNIKTLLSPELRFLIACCQTNPSENDINLINNTIQHYPTEIPLGATFNIQHLPTLSSQHGILPLVYKTIKRLSADHSSFKKVLTALKAHYVSISHRNILMTSELIKIMRLFGENNIEALAFKGPSLAQTAYGDITLRQYGDLDILIRRKDRVKMISLMTKEGYIPEITLRKHTQKTFFNAVNVIGLSNISNGVRIEIHWELLSRNYAIDWDEKDLWSAKQSIQINYHTIPVLPTEQLLLYLCAHGSKHLFERLEWICDIDRTVRTHRDLNWEHLLMEAEKPGIKRMLFFGLALCQVFFDLPLPPAIKKQITEDTQIPKLISEVIDIHFSSAEKERKNYSTFGLLWSMRENFTDRLCFANRALFSAKFDDFQYIQLPDNLAFLYPLVRPYRLITKYFKR